MRLDFVALAARIALATALSGATAQLGAQAAAGPSITVHVRVTDTSGAPVGGTEVSVHAGQVTVAGSTTDSSGRHTFHVPARHADYDLVVRHFGFAREDRFFVAAAGDTLSLDVVLHRTVAALGPVIVSAAATVRQHDYNIDADEIAKSTRWLGDVNDIIRKLRPMMWTSRSPEVCANSYSQPYAALSNVYVNGQRVPVIKQYDTASQSKSPLLMPGHASAVSLNGLPRADNKWIREQVTDVLHMIKPEHVAELHFLDCVDTLPGIDATDALYIVLKPGIGYDFARGSYVVPQRAARQVAARAPAAALPAYRSRIIGVFAASGGFPLGDVAVIDDDAGLQTLTLPTGAASLAFLPEGETRIRLAKAGYRDTAFVVSITPADTVPITMLLDVSDTSRRSPRPRH